MPDSRTASIRAAHSTTKRLGTIFAKLGSNAHPRGLLIMAYRNARRALRDVYRRTDREIAALEVNDVFNGLLYQVRQIAGDNLSAAINIGTAQAVTEAEAWGIGIDSPSVPIAPMIDSIISIVDRQRRAAVASAMTGGDPALIIGDEMRTGLLRFGEVQAETARWLTVAAISAIVSALSNPAAQTGIMWGKQAIAAIDDRTTDCCLNVNGQVVPFDEKFHLTGTPRFADDLDWSPFHWNCRTSIAMVPLELSDDDMTARLLRDADLEKRRRAGAV